MAADLSRISLFQGLKAEDLRALSERSAVRTLPADAQFIQQGDPADALYAILRGRVKVYLTDANGKECVVDIRAAGQYVGEMMLDDRPRSASVKAIEPCEVAEIPRADFKALLMQEDVRTRSELQFYIEQLKASKGEDLPSVKRWVMAKRWVLVTLLVFAVGQYYFLDILLEMMSIGGITFLGAR